MALVTLIQKVDSADRDAIVQIEDWMLPKEVYATGKVDAAGRKIYSVIKDVEVSVGNDVTATAKKVEAEVAKVEVKVTPTANTAREKIKKIEEEVKADLKAAVTAVVDEAEKVASELGFHPNANTTTANTANT